MMKLQLSGVAALALLLSSAAMADAHAATLTATRPGVMCVSPDALAKLTLPDGSSRSAGTHPRPEDVELKRQGGCVDISLGAHVTVVTPRKLTSIVTFDPNDGGGTRTFVAPNVDFAPGPEVQPGAGSSCYSYNVPVTLSGRVTVGSAYGEDLRTGKTGTERWQQITLDRPICTRASPSTYEDAEQDVRSIQPVWQGSGPYPFTIGKHVTVAGQLFHQDNGNQKTAVLISTKQVVVDR